MGQYNLGSLSSSGTAIRVVSAGDPPTLVLNHSTKNTVYIGGSNAVGSGNLLDATPLDPYASIVVNGTQDVFAVAAVPTQPATVYTYPNSIAWTPKAVQPNIVDPITPYSPAIGAAVQVVLTPPPGAQGLFIGWDGGVGFNTLIVSGVQSSTIYSVVSPTSLTDVEIWVPILIDMDSTIKITTTTTAARILRIVWIMNPFISGGVETGQVADVNIANIISTASLAVFYAGISNLGLAPNQVPVAFDANLTSGSTQVILPASVGVQYFIHDVRFELINGTATSMYMNLQDTTGATFANIVNSVFGVPSAGVYPPIGNNDFKGFPLPTGVGLQIKNAASATNRVSGYVVYSK